VEVLLAAASADAPPPLADLVEPELLDAVPADVPALLARLPQADVYFQDEVQFALLPTLTRVWCRKGRRGQRLVETPGTNAKVYGFGLVDWRAGWFDGRLAPGRTAAPFCEQLRAAVARSRARGRVALVFADNLSTHTPEGSKLVRHLLAEQGDRLRLLYTPPYDPEANRIEQLWRVSRRAVTHTHRRTALDALSDAAEAHFQALRDDPAAVLRHIGSPFAPDPDERPVAAEVPLAA
jgi:transposase